MTVRVVTRCIKILELIASRSPVCITDIARALKLPRATVYRMVQTFIKLGYVVRDPESKLLWCGPSVLSLYTDKTSDVLLEQHARPIVRKFASTFRWPVMVLRPREGSMEVVVSTCKGNPYAITRSRRGDLFPISNSAAGIAYLSGDPGLMGRFCKDIPHQSANSLGSIKLMTLAAERAGYAMRQDPENREAIIAAPFNFGTDYMAVVAFRFIRAAISDERLTTEIVPKLKQLSRRLADAETNSALKTGTGIPSYLRRCPLSEFSHIERIEGL